MEAGDTASPNPQPAPAPALASEEASPEDDTPPAFSSSSPSAHAAAPPGAREVAVAMEAVERDAAAIAENYASLFASLRVALSNVCVLLRTVNLRTSFASLSVLLQFTH